MSDPITSAIGLGVGIIGSIGKLFGNAKSNKELGSLEASDPNYATSAAGVANQNIAGNRLSLAQNLLNAKQPGSAQAERNIYAGYGNQEGNIQRNAGSGEQALALGAANVGQANDSFDKLQQQQSQNYQQNLQNLTGAQQGMIGQNNEVFQDQTRRFGDQAQIQGAMNANRQNTWSSIENIGGAVANVGLQGGFSGIFGGGNPIGTGSGQVNPYTQSVGNIPQNQINP